MYLLDNIKEKFINESADIMIDSINDYSEYINENYDFQYFTELSYQHLIGYIACENFLTENRRFSAFSIVGDYVLDYKDIMGEAPTEINSEYVYSFYLDTYLSRLAFELEDKTNSLCFNENGIIENKLISIIENWRAEELGEINGQL